MTKKVNALNLIPLIVLLTTLICFGEEQEALYRARLNVCSLIEAGKFAEAKTATGILTAEFKDYSALPESLYWIAERYDRQEKYESAVNIWQQVINDYPGNPVTSKAKLSISRANIFSLIASEKYDLTNEEIEKFIADFTGYPDLPEALYWIATKFVRQDRFEDAKNIYGRISSDYSYSPWADKAKIASARADIKALIVSGKYDLAQTALETFAADFASSPDLAEALYSISKLYEIQNYSEGIKQCNALLQNIPANIYARKAKLDETKANIIALIEAGNFVDAAESVDKMTVDFINHRDLPETLFWLAERYQRYDRFVEAKKIYQTITGIFPDTIWADKSKLWFSRINILSLLVSKDYDGAKIAIDKFITDFAGNSELPEALFWIAERYQREDKFKQATQIYSKLINDYSTNPFAEKSKFWLSRITVLSLIVSQDYTVAKEALDKFILDFSANPDLPEALFWIAERYQRQNRNEEASLIYQKIKSNWPDSPFANKTTINAAQPATILSAEAPASNESPSDINIAEASQEQQQKAAELYAIAREYENIPERADDVLPMYERVIKEYPGTVKSNNAVLDIRRLEIWEKIKAGEANEANILMDKFITDFKQNKFSSDCLFSLAEKCFLTAKDSENQKEKSWFYYETSSKIWDRVIAHQTSPELITEAFYISGLCYQKLCEFLKAAESFSNSYQSNPEFMYADFCLFSKADCYEKAKERQADIAITDDQIKNIYQEVVKKFPKSRYAFNAALRLDELQNGTK